MMTDAVLVLLVMATLWVAHKVRRRVVSPLIPGAEPGGWLLVIGLASGGVALLLLAIR